VLGAALGGAILIGMQSSHLPKLTAAPLPGPAGGEPLPSLQVESAGVAMPLSTMLVGTGACGLLVFYESTCPACRRMRRSWNQRFQQYRDASGHDIRAMWLTAEEEGAAREFIAGYDFDGITLAQVAPGYDRALSRMGFYSTPTIFLIDSGGRLRYGIIGDLFPPAATIEQVCGSALSS
jgi:hypothetical protein